MKHDFTKAFLRHKRQHHDALLLFVADGLVTAYLQDADAVASVFDLPKSRAEKGPTLNIRRASFPEVVLKRNWRTLAERGYLVAVVRERIDGHCDDLRRFNQLPQQNTPNHLPSESEIAAATAAIREGWDEREYYMRAGVSPPVVEWEEMPDAVLFEDAAKFYRRSY